MSLINFYDTIKSDPKLNPNYEKHKIKISFRAVVACGSGGGKSILALNLILSMNNTFHRIIICSLAQEPLYDMVKKRLKDKAEIYYDGIIPEIEPMPKGQNALIIFDDLVLNQSPIIGQYFIRGRKKGYSSIFISQSFYKVDKLIRINSNYIWLGRGLLSRDLNMILNEFSVGLNKEEFKKLYNIVTKKEKDEKINNFLCIDIDGRNLRKNIEDIIYEF